MFHQPLHHLPAQPPASFRGEGWGKEELAPVRRVVLKQTRVRIVNDTLVLSCREQGVSAKRPSW